MWKEGKSKLKKKENHYFEGSIRNRVNHDKENIIGIRVINENDGTICTLCKLYVYQRFARASK